MRRKPKRRLSVQHLDNRRLFAADIGASEAPYGPEVPAMVETSRPLEVDPIALRPIFDPECPICFSEAELSHESFINLGSDDYDCQGQGGLRMSSRYALLADIAVSEMESQPVPTRTQPIVFGPINGDCPPCEFESKTKANTTPKRTGVERPGLGPHWLSCDGLALTEQILVPKPRGG